MAAGSSETQQSHPHSPPNVSPRRKPSQQMTSHCKHWSLALVRNIHKSASPVKRGSKRQHGVFFFLSTKRETWPRAQEANSMWKEKQTHRCKNQSREETGCWETSDWYAGKKPTSWYIDGLDRDGMVKERILLLPSLSTISCQVKDKKKNRKKSWINVWTENNFVLPKRALRSSGFSVTTARQTAGQVKLYSCQCCLWLRWLWLTDVWFMWEREQHDNSCTALSSRDEVETLEQMGIWHELVLKRSHIPPSFRSLFLSRAPGKQLRTVNYCRDSKKRFSKQHFYFPAIASC